MSSVCVDKLSFETQIKYKQTLLEWCYSCFIQWNNRAIDECFNHWLFPSHFCCNNFFCFVLFYFVNLIGFELKCATEQSKKLKEN